MRRKPHRIMSTHVSVPLQLQANSSMRLLVSVLILSCQLFSGTALSVTQHADSHRSVVDNGQDGHRSTLIFSPHKRSGRSLVKWASRCIRRYTHSLYAEVLLPENMLKKQQRKGAMTALFVRSPIDLAVSHFIDTRSTQDADDYILPGTASEVQELISSTLKINASKWMTVNRKESYQQFLLRAPLTLSVRAHLAHLTPEIQTMETSLDKCSRDPAHCKLVHLERFKAGGEAYMKAWKSLLADAGMNLDSSSAQKLKDCLAQKDPSAVPTKAVKPIMLAAGKLGAARIGSNSSRTASGRALRRSQAQQPLSNKELGRIRELVIKVDKERFGGRLERLAARVSRG